MHIRKRDAELDEQIERADGEANPAQEGADSYDYSYVRQTARIATYDDMLSAPRISEVEPAPTAEFIENLTTKVYELARGAGGSVPYTVIREVSENFIHARFKEIIVSIMDGGNTIRFADQGPGIAQKEKAQMPGYSSATEPMKRYIRGVGSGLPIVKEYLDLSHGDISIDDNMEQGAVVTISLAKKEEPEPKAPKKRSPVPAPPLNQRERDFLALFLSEGALGVTDLSRLTEVPASSTHAELTKMEQAGLVEKTAGQKRVLTDYGYEVASAL